MSRYGERVLDRLEGFVSDVEAGTSAELVLVLAHRAERYPDVPFKVGRLAGRRGRARYVRSRLSTLTYVSLSVSSSPRVRVAAR